MKVFSVRHDVASASKYMKVFDRRSSAFPNFVASSDRTRSQQYSIDNVESSTHSLCLKHE